MKTLKELYDSIPKFACTPGCNLCCGPTPCNAIEQQALNIHQAVTPINPLNNTCLFSTPNGCSKYNDRPLMCRLYGTVKMLQCPKNNKPKEFLTPKQEKKLMQNYRLLSKDMNTAAIKELFSTTITTSLNKMTSQNQVKQQ